MIPYNFIAIEGAIGAGKTTLASMIAHDYNARLILEQFEDNAFLPKFYSDQEKYAFPLEMSFMASRFQQLKDQLGTQDLFKTFTIADYYILKSLVFARQTLPRDEFQLFTRFFNFITQNIPKPDLLVYLFLEVPKLQENIRNRGRIYEQEIDDQYLQKIQNSYFEFFRQQPQMRILLLDTNKIDFVHNKTDYKQIIDIMSKEYEPGIHRFTF
ncbi:MAG: deoxynucleoside kinase [Bacteroidales bacterium]|jgi:deoxyadenosine/deoxycytidine kinase|nr:deoxynucleoside kinase [Bacteroidales bacterium]MDD3701297.1 deoxynucleoside kinase [Bacteroidales bacterium]MDY0368426.1 deoxynucleoside kinase [Bacteroidales bacterium]